MEFLRIGIYFQCKFRVASVDSQDSRFPADVDSVPFNRFAILHLGVVRTSNLFCVITSSSVRLNEPANLM